MLPGVSLRGRSHLATGPHPGPACLRADRGQRGGRRTSGAMGAGRSQAPGADRVQTGRVRGQTDSAVGKELDTAVGRQRETQRCLAP